MKYKLVWKNYNIIAYFIFLLLIAERYAVSRDAQDKINSKLLLYAKMHIVMYVEIVFGSNSFILRLGYNSNSILEHKYLTCQCDHKM